MSKLIFLLTVWFFIGGASAGEGGSSVGNGGGVSENNILQAWEKLPDYHRQLLKGLDLTLKERRLLVNLQKRWVSEKNSKLKFLQESQYPFQGRMSVSGSKLGSPMYFNLDQLFRMENQEKIPFTLGESVSLVTQALQRSQQILGTAEMDVFRKKISSFFNRTMTTMKLSRYHRDEIQISTLDTSSSVDVYMMDSVAIHNVTEIVNKALPCEQKSRQVTKLWNFHLGSRDLDVPGRRQEISYLGFINFKCGEQPWEGKISIKANYLLQAKDSVLIDDQWWEDSRIQAGLMMKELEIQFTDIH